MRVEAELFVAPDGGGAYRRCAELFVEASAAAISSTGRFTVALSGGSTPTELYGLLSGEAYRLRISWQDIHFFWGDERYVPPDHADSNFRMTKESLLDRIGVPSSNIHQVVTDREDPAQIAAEYESQLVQFFRLARSGQPRFDLILLGMGEDGHTASLFPETPALQVKDRAVVANYVEKLESWRITLTPPAINNALHVIFLITGASKASAVRDVLEGPYRPERLPSQLIDPVKGRLTFILDRAAAGGLSAPSLSR
ncbi:MAG: 6-phosphogluconolactonase [Acidobacteriota bacterium]